MDRREFLIMSLLVGAASCKKNKEKPELTRFKPITQGPYFHWFGYYDKPQFDPSDTFCLGMEAYFEGRHPTVDDKISIGFVDIKDKKRQFIKLGESKAWSWQLGCMLQWIPGTKKIIWNDRKGDIFISKIMDFNTREILEIPQPIFCVSPDGKNALTVDYPRLGVLRKGYSYPVRKGIDLLSPENTGVWNIDLLTGKYEMIFNLDQIINLGPHPRYPEKTVHWINHLLHSPDGKRFIFLHRWKHPRYFFQTRLITCDIDGKNLFVLDRGGRTSHFTWRDNDHILAWSNQKSFNGWKFTLFKDKTLNYTAIGDGVMTENGHCTYLPDKRWILNDTYPDKKTLKQTVYLFDTEKNTKHILASLKAPRKYKGGLRCDTHPRYSTSGKTICIDSTHGLNGRQMYITDVTDITG